MLEDSVAQLRNKVSELDDIAHQLGPIMPAHVADSKATLGHRADMLSSTLHHEQERLTASIKEQSQFADKYHIISTFLDTLPAEDSRLSTVDIEMIAHNISSVKETLAKIEAMQREMSRLNEFSDELSLADDDAERLRVLNVRWDVTCQRSRDTLSQLELRLAWLDTFTDQCGRWTEFVNQVKTDVTVPPACSYDTLVERQQNVEVVGFVDCIMCLLTMNVCFDSIELTLHS